MTNTSLFTPTTEGGLSFKIRYVCSRPESTVDCSITFDPTGRISTYGGLGHHQILPNPSVAGIGIWYGWIPTCIISFIGLCYFIGECFDRIRPRYDVLKNNHTLPHRRFLLARWYDARYTVGERNTIQAFSNVMLALADSQTTLAIAIIVVFSATSACSVTAYHYTVAINCTLIACSAMVSSVAMVRDYWRAPLAAALRLIIMSAVFGCLFFWMAFGLRASQVPSLPSSTSSLEDHLLLLPIACFLDKNLFPQIDDSLKKAPKEHSNLGTYSPLTREWPMYLALLSAFLLAHLSHIIRLRERHQRADGQLPWLSAPSWRLYGSLLYWFYVLIAPLIVAFMCWGQTGIAREWANESDWLASNSEKNIMQVGQLLPIVVAGYTIVSLANSWRPGEGRGASQGGKGGNQWEMDRWSGATDRTWLNP